MTVACSEYRLEQILVRLRRRLAEERLQPDERSAVEAEIKRLESALNLD